MMLKTPLNIHHTCHVVVYRVSSRTKFLFHDLKDSWTGQDTGVEFEFLVHTEKGTSKSIGFFF